MGSIEGAKVVYDDSNSVFPINIVRTNRRKTISISVAEGYVRVLVPKRLSEKEVSQIIDKKLPWIRDKIRDQSQIVPVKPREYVTGSNFMYLGKNYKLKLIPNGFEQVKLLNGCFVLGINGCVRDKNQQSIVREKLVDWYCRQSEKHLRKRTDFYGKILGVEPKKIQVKQYKSRWGSCSAKGDIGYNWTIIMAPNHVIDYIVVHELSHILEHNHSPAFWLRVEGIIPNYKLSRDWLKNVRSLTI
tara:strand:+ start:91 stop:822 length:732 start_codon:yes stop_codon:yes gene_type:complete